MGYTKTIELSIDSDDVAKYISDTIADCISDAISSYLESKGYPDGTISDVLQDDDFWNGVIEDLMPQLKA